jgi:peptidoglycan/LPS O-acetylase OafA/YrhL
LPTYRLEAIGSHLTNPAYRPDVDGLRALAVLAVVGFHAFPSKVAGGFVGVDIFFVISGFLISSIILKDLERDKFSFLEFYARRAKRIFPALAAVLIACLSVGWFVLFPDDYQQLGKHVSAGAGFVGNFAALQEAGYFDASGSFKPLLHLWSLGIEEQFYIVWPGLLLLSWRWRHGPILLASAILIVSFASNLLLTITNQPAAFYLPVTRFWELMLGCLVAIAQSKGQLIERFEQLSLGRGHMMKELAAWLGMALILAAAALINQNSSFPGLWALLPTLGSVLLIASGGATVIGRRLLGHPLLVHIGLISYPLYLWHWPILAFVRIFHYEEPSRWERTVCIVAAFILAELTYRYVERPIRFGALTPTKPVMTAVALGCAGSLGLAIFGHAGVPDRFPADVQRWVRDFRSDVLTSGEVRCFVEPTQSISKLNPSCDGTDQPNLRKVVLWGDSHAAQLVPGLREIERKQNNFSLAQYTASGCPPIFGFVTRRIPNCGLINEYAARKIEQVRPDLVIMAGRWDLYDGSDGVGRVDFDVIQMTIERLKSLGVKHVVAIGQFPIWKVAPQKILARSYRLAAAGFGPTQNTLRERDKRLLNPSTFARSEDIRQAFQAAGVTVVSPLSTFCDNKGCLLVVPGGEPVSWDRDGHLTEAGSIYFVTTNAENILGAAEEPRTFQVSPGSNAVKLNGGRFGRERGG